jgi:DNA replication protein DnaC
MMIDDLEFLLKELGCKTPAGEIPSDQREIVIGFLKMEIEYRRQHKIKRLLRLSGIKHVKTLDQFDWHFNPKISKDDILTFVHSPWIENASNLVLIGDTGLGPKQARMGRQITADARSQKTGRNVYNLIGLP